MTQRHELPGDSGKSLTLVNGGPAPARGVCLDLSSPTVEEHSEWVRFFELSRLLSRRKGTILLAALLGVLLATGISIWCTPMYRASASLEVQGLNEDFLDLRNMDPAAKAGTFSMESYIQTQADILQDEVLLQRVIDRLRLAERPSFQPAPSPLAPLVRTLRFRSGAWFPAVERPIDVVRQDLQVTPSRQSRIIRISYDSSDRQLAADFVNTLAEEFISYNLAARLHAANEIGQWLSPQLQDMKEKLERSEAELQAYSQGAGLILTSEKDSVAEEKLRQLQRDLSAAQADRIAKQSLYQMASGSPPDSFPPILDTAGLREHQAKLTELRRQHAELSSLYTADNYKVARVQAQIEELEAGRQREAQNVPRRAKNEYEAAATREALLGRAYASQAELVTQQARQRIRYDMLKREVDSNREIYEATLRKVKEAGISSAIKPSNARIVGAAIPPARPYRPNLFLNLSLGLAGGLCLGLIGALMLERNKHVLRMPGEVNLYLHLPELGAIPAATNRSLQGSTGRRLLDVKSASARVELVTWEEKRCAMSESFREVLASLLYAGPNRTLLITSSCMMEGKTTVVSNLGIALAEIDKRVLLIDGDLRKPRLHDIFNQSNSWGLSNLLAEKNCIESLPLNVLVRKTAIPGLCLLPSGPATDQIATLLYSPRMQDLMNHFRQEFDYVFLDAPPVLLFADAKVLSHVVDAVVLVIRANRTDPRTAKAAAERFQMVGTPILGTILNDWDPSTAADGYGYRYRY